MTPWLLAFCIYMLIGMLNMVVAFDQKILMIRDEFTTDSVLESVFFVLLWPMQVAWALMMWLLERKQQ